LTANPQSHSVYGAKVAGHIPEKWPSSWPATFGQFVLSLQHQQGLLRECVSFMSHTSPLRRIRRGRETHADRQSLSGIRDDLLVNLHAAADSCFTTP
jgi:hypothetical protein